MRPTVRGLAALLLLVWWAPAAVAAARPAAAGDGPKTVGGSIIDFEIQVPSEPLQVGDSIQWINNGQRPHTITDRGGMFDTGPIAPGGQELHTFPLTAPGTYFLFCEINPARMNATITVEPGPEPPADVRVQAVDEARDGAAKAFDPPELEVAAGTRVILANVGGQQHSLTAEDGSFDTGIVEPGAEGGRFHGNSTAVRVDDPGTYPFFCIIHPDAMRGVLTVTDEQAGEEVVEIPPLEDDVPIAPLGAAADVAMNDGEGLGLGFEPTSTPVAPGATVTWTNHGALSHTATFDDVLLDTGTVVPGAEASLTLPDQPGTYSYFCRVHPAVMRAVIVVQPREGLRTTGVSEGDSQDDETDGTVLAYVLAVLVVGTGALGLVLALRKRPA